MKIYIIPIDKKYRPEHHSHYNGIKEILGPLSMEEQFYNWIKNSDKITNNKNIVDFYYLPIYWYKIKDTKDYNELNNIIKNYDLSKIFTVNTLELEWIKWNKLKEIIVFSGGFDPKKWNNVYNIPLLRYDLLKEYSEKKYKMSFSGKWTSHTFRYNSILQIKNNDKIFIFGQTKEWGKILSESYISYCPRGYFPNTIRFWESLQLGVVPLIYSEYDFRPFKEFIEWDDFSFFINDYKKIEEFLNIDNETLLNMGKKGKEFFFNNIWNSKWCDYIMEYLQKHLY